MRNWRNRNISLFDDFRDFYDDFPEITKTNDLQKRQSKENLDHMASVLFSRTINYCMSYELITGMFFIQKETNFLKSFGNPS